jgi:glycosyltransferase involved in cell wall biosynthesis
MKKICIMAEFPIGVLDGVMTGRGGGQAATWLPQLAKAWENQKDFEIHWCILDRATRNIVSTQCWKQHFHRLPCPSVTTSMLLARWPQRLAYRKIINQINPNLVHCWGTETLHGAGLLEFDGPSILSMQGVITTYYKTGELKGWRWKLFRHWEPLSMRNATVITSESHWGMKKVDSIVPGKTLSKVEYGVFPSYYDVTWQPDPKKPRILFVGGLGRLKGIDIILEMLKRYPKRSWQMVFAGGGNLAEELKSLNDPSVEVLGTLKTNEVQAEMAKAWALVMPSRADTSPNVVKEARVIGLPIVGSPHGGHAEYIDHGNDGFIVPSEDPEEWFQALDQLASNIDLCQSMGSARHEYFREYFRPEKTAEAFLKLYREMLEKA